MWGKEFYFNSFVITRKWCHAKISLCGHTYPFRYRITVLYWNNFFITFSLLFLPRCVWLFQEKIISFPYKIYPPDPGVGCGSFGPQGPAGVQRQSAGRPAQAAPARPQTKVWGTADRTTSTQGGEDWAGGRRQAQWFCQVQWFCQRQGVINAAENILALN